MCNLPFVSTCQHTRDMSHVSKQLLFTPFQFSRDCSRHVNRGLSRCAAEFGRLVDVGRMMLARCVIVTSLLAFSTLCCGIASDVPDDAAELEVTDRLSEDRFLAAPWLGGDDRIVYSFRQQRHPRKDRFGTASFEPDATTPFRLSWRNGAAAVAAAVCAMLANAAGLGGGPFFQVIFNLVVGFDLRLCAGLSHTVVAVGALGAVLYSLLQPSPSNPQTTLLNFDLAMVLVPAMLFGISGGVVLCPLSPEWLQTALLSMLLVAVTHKTFSQGIAKWRQEQLDRQILTPHNSPPVLQPMLAAEHGTALSPVPENEVSLIKKHRLRSNSRRAGSAIAVTINRIPFFKAGALALLWVAFVGIQLVKAQQHHCSWQYFCLVLGQSAVLASFAATFAYRQACKAQRDPLLVDPEFRKVMARPPDEASSHVSARGASSAEISFGSGSRSETVVYEPLRMLKVVSVVAAAGFIAGLLGIAGALLFNPFLLAIGIQPQIVAATAIVIVLFGSGAISLSFWFNGMLNTSFLAVYAPIAFIASLLGVTLCSWAIRRTGRQSVLLLLMSGVLACGLVSVVIFGGQHTMEDIRGGRRVGFNSFCDD